MDQTIGSAQSGLQGTLHSSDGSFARIAGYSGHIPRAYSDPGYFGRTCTNLAANLASTGDVASTAPLHETPEKTQTPRTPGVSQAQLAIQGYRGHIPGKADIIGHTFKVATSRGVDGFLAATNKSDQQGKQGQQMWRRTSAPGVELRPGTGVAPGKSIPGYTGYIPGVKPDVCGLGMTVSEAIVQADRMQKHMRNRTLREERPSSTPKASSTVTSARSDGLVKSARSGTQTEDRPLSSTRSDGALRSVRSGQSSGKLHEKTLQAGSVASGRLTERSHRSQKSEGSKQAESVQRSGRSGKSGSRTERSHRSEGSTMKLVST